MARPSCAAAGSHIWDADGNRYLDATAGLWFCNVGHGRAEIAEARRRQIARARGVLHVRRSDEPSDRGARRAGRRARADAEREGVPDERRVGLDRHRHQDRAPLLVAGRRARANGPDPARTRVPRDARGGDLARRGSRRTWRGTAGCCRTWSRSPWDDADGAPVRDRPGRRGPGRRVLLRAGDRRGRRLPAAGGLPARPRAESAARPACCSSPTR